MSKPVPQPTTAQSLGALLKSARDILLRESFGGQVILFRFLAK
jgi:hypothetical protein